jgi:ATP-dependent RNA helicase DDX24/MAK5
MSILKKRNWKTFELAEDQMADFSAMGGIEIDVLSDDSDIPKELAKKKPNDEQLPDKPKRKKKKAKLAVKGDSSVSGEPEQEKELIISKPDVDISAWCKFQTVLHDRIISGLRNLRFTTPSPIQAAVLDKAMEGLDILGAAQTGSGKTLAFGIPILHSILSSPKDSSTRALCILPTRELAIQVRDHFEALIGSEVRVATAVGGMSVEKQFRLLTKNPHVVVGTPGRIAGLLGLSKNKENSQICTDFKQNLCQNLSFFVLDEADRLLEDSHFRDLTSIMRFLYQSIPSADALQSFIFSATLPVEGVELGKLVKRLRLKPVNKRFIIDLVRTADSTDGKPLLPTGLGFQTMYATEEEDREPALLYYLMKRLLAKPSKIIVFVNAISYVYRLSSLLPECLPNTKVVGIHSNLRQKDRLKKLDQFKSKNSAVLVATDLAARGLDLPSVDSVVHLQPPRSPESLVHRSGRTARAGREGECIMIITPQQVSQWNKAIKLGLGRDPETLPVIDLVSMDIRNVRAIHRLASKIEGQSHKDRRSSKEKAWTKKTCEEADLWDSDASNGFGDSDDEILVAGRVRNESVRITDSSDREELDRLLKTPLPSFKKSFQQ